MTIQPLSMCPMCGAGLAGPGAACGVCGHGSSPGWGPGYAASGPPPYGAPRPGPYGYQAPYGPGPGGPPQWGQPPAPQHHHHHHHVAEKSAGVAVLLTFLWLGAGHLYLNRVTPGVLLLVLDFFLVLFFLFVPILGWILGFVGWLVAFCIAAASCSSIAAADNDMRRRQVGYGW